MQDIFEDLLNKKDIKEVIETSRGNFTIKFPLGKDYRTIQLLLLNRFPGVNLNHIQEAVLHEYQIYAVLDTVVVDSPKFWKKLESAEECPDSDLVMELYRGYLRFRKEIQDRIQSSSPGAGKDNRTDESADKKETMDNGALQKASDK
ncbi:MAG: hypothetical protein WC516_06545 [Patescibacteria group bacterium]|jgi:hypothetical protein